MGQERERKCSTTYVLNQLMSLNQKTSNGLQMFAHRFNCQATVEWVCGWTPQRAQTSFKHWDLSGKWNWESNLLPSRLAHTRRWVWLDMPTLTYLVIGYLDIGCLNQPALVVCRLLKLKLGMPLIIMACLLDVMNWDSAIGSQQSMWPN